MPTFRKRPVEVEAFRWDGTAAGATPIIDWVLSGGGTATLRCSDPTRCAETDGDTPHGIDIRTLEGTMCAGLGDWIIKGVQGEFYPCKDAIFRETYELVDRESWYAELRAEAAKTGREFERLMAAIRQGRTPGDEEQS